MASDTKAYIHEKTGSIVFPKGRILWNSLFKPRKGKGGKEGKYEFNLLLPKGADLTVAKDEALTAAREKFPKLFKDTPAGKFPSGIKSPFKKTSENDKIVAALEVEGKTADDYPVYVAARSQDKPGVAGPNGKTLEDPEQVYAGRWAKFTCDAYGYDVDGNKGATFGLKNVQLLDNDEEMSIGGSRVSAEAEFEAVEGAGQEGSSSDELFN